MTTYAPINQTYIVDQDSSVTFDSPVIDLVLPYKAINYQLKWADANVKGQFIWKASIFSDPYVWEEMVSCQEVKFSTRDAPDGVTSMIVSLPTVWLSQGFLKFTWVPFASGSAGNIQTAIRIVPI